MDRKHNPRITPIDANPRLRPKTDPQKRGDGVTKMKNQTGERRGSRGFTEGNEGNEEKKVFFRERR